MPTGKAAPAPAPTNNKLGVSVSNDKTGGVRVDRLLSTTVLHEVRPGDVIVELDGKQTPDIDALEKVLAGAKGGSMLLGKVKRGDVIRFVPIPVPK
jgi:hypothetical protein